MSITSPTERLWWKEPLHRPEIIWIAVSFVWGLIMFFAMIYWHIYGEQNLSNEAYRVDPEAYAAKAEQMVAQYQVREEGDTGMPVVHPPAGSDVYLIARLWEWWPVLELEKGQSYRLHLSSMDWQHGFSLQPVNINVQVHPGYDMVMTITPDETGTFSIVCNEYCGIGHHTMTGRIHVVEK
ncbi:MAG: cytochrome C oxidase subunit II [Dongiaceae bacterium]